MTTLWSSYEESLDEHSKSPTIQDDKDRRELLTRNLAAMQMRC